MSTTKIPYFHCTLNNNTNHRLLCTFSPLLKNIHIHTKPTSNFIQIKNPSYEFHLNASSSPINPVTTNNNDNGDEDRNLKPKHLANEDKKSFWGAVTLIIGTAVGPGMLGLPAATIKSGPIPSTISIILSWVYVISSIILVAELSFATMEQDNVTEVSFTSLAINALGPRFGAFVALVYASLSFALLIACVSGISSIVCQWFPPMNAVVAHSLFPLIVGVVIVFLPFTAIDNVNRLLCLVMLFSITALVVIGLLVARASVFGSFGFALWSVGSILPSVPVTVLTLGFHVITPFICKIAGDSVAEARKAILVGGVVPLIMVLSWNLIVLGLAGKKMVSSVSSTDPISLLLSVNPSALSAVQGFAFSALATSLIGYAVSFPKQLLDTFDLIFRIGKGEEPTSRTVAIESKQKLSLLAISDRLKVFVTPLVLVVPVLIAAHFPSIFSKALDFAGIYANCFLFGILPPVMTYIYQSRDKVRSYILPGGDGALLLLFIFSVILGIWH